MGLWTGGALNDREFRKNVFVRPRISLQKQLLRRFTIFFPDFNPTLQRLEGRHEALGMSSLIVQLFYFRYSGCIYFIGSRLIGLQRYSVIIMCQIFSLRERNTSTVAVVLRVPSQKYQADPSIHWSCRDMNIQADRWLQWLRE